MNKNSFILLILFSWLLIITSCKVKEKPISTPYPQTFRYPISDYFKMHTPHKFLTCKANVNYYKDKQDYSFYVNSRIIYDSAIWLSVSPGLGIEALRIMLTNDSIFYLDRTRHKYITESLQIIRTKWNLPFDIKVFQAIITADFLRQSDSIIYTYKKTDKGLRVINNNANYIDSMFPLNNPKIIDVYLNEKKPVTTSVNFDINSCKISTITINYKEHKLIDNEYLPTNWNIYLQGKESKKIDISIDKWQKTDKVVLHFVIPPDYESLIIY
ncbi:MAG TPA: DUF4292 domain-containing protein [Bacteroidales bacterium]|nr:DUF4292 domain-containing protein [Bacteroidales bacterium]MDI9573090.1 DUF4292 domain-containing protein [Bacteroidota bacterium]OQC60734.1 MAG: hypothetical protein BWX51_00860 [Bacteroidetes bacterium ADurb.Bin012]NMD15833.1 DUF4292 domain-containing protein [Bacteroidales bacterium]HNQ59834.1 DUF4292 domain-containing protein [Bacteroidales bacterium]